MLDALSRVASDLATRKITLEDIWSTESKLAYIDELEHEGVLPPLTRKSKQEAGNPDPSPKPPKLPGPKPSKPAVWPHLIPEVDYGVVWTARLQRHREIWEELQFKLEMSEHPNAISVLLRVLLELSIDNYVSQTRLATVHENDKLSKKAIKVADALEAAGKIDKKYQAVIRKLEKAEGLVSMDTLNRYVHSPNFNVSPDHLKMLWNTLSSFIVCCLAV